MNIYLALGIILVNLALIAYTVAVVLASRGRMASAGLMRTITAGVLLDIMATICMVTGSSHTFISSHGLLGYSALLLMLTDCILLWQLRRKEGRNAPLSTKLRRFTRYAYAWWIIAYVAGVVIVAWW